MIDNDDYVPYQIGQKHPFISILNTDAQNICLREPSACSCYLFFLYNAAVFSAGRREISKIGLFLTEICDLQRLSN